MKSGKLIMLCALILVASAFSFGKVGGEDHGSGLTDQEADFIKARIIEISKQTKDVGSIADMLQSVVSAALGNVWGVVILNLDKYCSLVIRPGDPLDDKWIQVDKIGSYSNYFYVVWKNRLCSFDMHEFINDGKLSAYFLSFQPLSDLSALSFTTHLSFISFVFMVPRSDLSFVSHM